MIVQQQAGIETILHYACRDRNLLGMQSDLLGAHSMGIRNVLLVTGDPPQVGDYPDATAVFDVDSIGLTNVVARLNRGLDIGGQSIGPPTAFHIGVAANPGAFNLDEEIRRFEYKVEAGAEFAVTQPVFDVGGAASGSSIARGPPHPDPRGDRAAREPPARGVHGERGAGRASCRTHRRAHAGGRGRRPGGGGRDGIAREIAAEVRPLVQGVQISPAAGGSAQQFCRDADAGGVFTAVTAARPSVCLLT